MCVAEVDRAKVGIDEVRSGQISPRSDFVPLRLHGPESTGWNPLQTSRRRHDPPYLPRKWPRRERPQHGGRGISHRWVGLSGQARAPSDGCHLAGPLGSRSASRAGRVGGERRDCAPRKVLQPPVSGVIPPFGGRRSASRQLFRTRPLSVRTRKDPRRSGGRSHGGKTVSGGDSSDSRQSDQARASPTVSRSRRE